MRADAHSSVCWRPLLEGDARDRATAAVDAIATELHAWVDAEHSLALGKPGLALLFEYLSRARPNSGYDQVARRLMQENLKLLAGRRTGPSLYSGYSGSLWLLAHLRAASAAAGDHPNHTADQALRDALCSRPWHGPYDLTAGLVGLGVYALERLPDPTSAELLGCVVARLGQLAERSSGGVSWFTSAELVPEQERVEAPHGYWNLGVAHGVPGAAALLAAAGASGVAAEEARRLAEGAVAWLLTIEGEGDARYPYWLTPGRPASPARSAWCYGDPGVAAALLVCARCTRNSAWEEAALEIALLATRRPRDQTGVCDAGLCHGAAGLAHIFNRMYQATGHPTLGHAACEWVERTLELRRPGHGVGGFSALVQGGSTGRWTADPGFLTGAAGVALALLAASSSVEPGWDRLLLMSTRAPSGA